LEIWTVSFDRFAFPIPSVLFSFVRSFCSRRVIAAPVRSLLSCRFPSTACRKRSPVALAGQSAELCAGVRAG